MAFAKISKQFNIANQVRTRCKNFSYQLMGNLKFATREQQNHDKLKAKLVDDLGQFPSELILSTLNCFFLSFFNCGSFFFSHWEKSRWCSIQFYGNFSQKWSWEIYSLIFDFPILVTHPTRCDKVFCCCILHLSFSLSLPRLSFLANHRESVQWWKIEI